MWDPVVAYSATQSPSPIAVLTWLREQSPHCPWDKRCTTAAAAGGDIATLRYLRDGRGLVDVNEDPVRCPWGEEACTAAARNGDISTLQWLRSQCPPCPWSAETCKAAAANGHTEVPKLSYHFLKVQSRYLIIICL
jgi:hypothetical protein